MHEIKGFIETSFVDWPGRLCSVIFLSGCNFRCPFCHNHPLVVSPEKLASFDFNDIVKKLLRYKKWLGGVCVSGGEPTLSPALFDILRVLRNKGFPIKLDTNGTRPEIIAKILDHSLVDMISMDVKAPLDQKKYEKCAGVNVDIEKIRRSIALIKSSTITYEFRMTVLPRLHSEDDIFGWVSDLGKKSTLKLQNFNPSSTLDTAYKNERPFSSEVFSRLKSVIS